jgi:hypothetical protein
MAEKFIYNDSAHIAPYSFLTSPNVYGINFNLLSAYYQITEVYLKLANFGTPVGLLTVNIYALTFVGSSWQPTGDVLATGNIAQELITDYTDSWSSPYTGVGALYKIDLGAGVLLAPLTQYGILFNASAGQLGVSFTAIMNSSPSGGYGPNVAASNFVFRNSTWQLFNTSFAVAQGWGDLVNASGIPFLPEFPIDRPDDYAPDTFWIPGEWDGPDYTDPEWSADPIPTRYFATGGGRWGQQLVAVGQSRVYYEELT